MSVSEQDNSGTPAPAVTQEPAQATKQAPKADAQEPNWLPERLSQARTAERKTLLGKLGVADESEVTAKLARLKELEDASLSEKEKTERLIAELAPKAQRLELIEKQFSTVVDAQFAALNDQQRAAIDSVAAGDPQERWKLMQVMAAAGQFAVAPIVAKPATTAPQAPIPPSPVPALTPRDKFHALQKTDTVAASLFQQLNARAIEESPQG